MRGTLVAATWLFFVAHDPEDDDDLDSELETVVCFVLATDGFGELPFVRLALQGTRIFVER